MPLSLEERAVAAEKTVAILKAKVRDLYNGDTNSVQRQLERAKQRQEETRRRQELMALRNQELQRYSETLESEVAERTRAIQTILDNVTFGFLVIGPELVVREGHTRSCHELLGQPEIAGCALADVLGMTPSQQAEFSLGVEQVFDDLLPEELSLSQLPARFELEGDRVLRLDARTIRGSANGVEALLVTLSDATALEHAQREAQHHLVLVNLLRKKDAFVRFLADSREQLSAARAYIAGGDTVRLRRALHTVKGNSAIFGLQDVSGFVHEVEGKDVIEHADIDGCETRIKRFLAANQEVLGITYEEADSGAIEIPVSRLRELQRLAQSGATHADIDSWVAAAMRKPAHQVLGPLDELVARLAERLEKDVSFELGGAEVLVEGERLRPVVQNLSHLIRNALDHGIEPPDERGVKPRRGHLAVRIVDIGDDLELRVEDDGRGIDTKRVAAKALEKGLIDAEQADRMSEGELLRLIFTDGLSTAQSANDVSGRGVGMSSVLAAVQQLGGDVEVTSSRGEGTSIALKLPKSHASAAQ